MSTASLYESRISSRGSGAGFGAIIALLLAIGIVYAGFQLYEDLLSSPLKSVLPYILLGIALLTALGFEFVNGFHDTANAVATVIYTHSMPPQVAVVWSGAFNFLGVLTSTGAVAFGIISLLPVELILQVGSEAGFAMVFALLIAATIWNLGTGGSASPIRARMRWSARSSGSARPTSCWRRTAAAPVALTGTRRSASANRCCSRR